METILEILKSRASLHPAKPLLKSQTTSLSYKNFWVRCQSLAKSLTRAGVVPGDRVSIELEEFDLLWIGLFGCWSVGAVAIPIAKSLPKSIQMGIRKKAKPILHLQDLSHIPRVERQQPASATAASMILFTSGTTGEPKGVCLSLESLSENAASTAEVISLSSFDRLMINTPPHYASALCHFLTMITVGGTLYVEKGFLFGENLLEIMESSKVTGFGGPPVHLMRVMESVPTPTFMPRFWISSGDFLPVATIKAAINFVPRIYSIYGLTEVSGRLTILEPDELPSRAGSVGVPLEGMKVTVRREDGTVAKPYETGEVFVQGSMVMLGYWKEPALNRQTLTPLGLRTGDFGYLDSAGFLWLEGRKDDLFKSGGEKVSVVKIREALLRTGTFIDVLVVPEQDEILGMIPCAYVVPKANFDRGIVLRHLRKELPPSHIPKRWVCCREIPRTGSGKVSPVGLIS